MPVVNVHVSDQGVLILPKQFTQALDGRIVPIITCFPNLCPYMYVILYDVPKRKHMFVNEMICSSATVTIVVQERR